jgi:KUP system potassium uptake protein
MTTPRHRRRTLHEGAHKLPDDGGDPSSRSGAKSFNEAAHKLHYWPAGSAPAREEDVPSEKIRAATDDERDVVAHAGRLVLALGALGVVFGDLGTSPLYTFQTIFKAHDYHAVHTNGAGVYGITSLVFWALIIIASIKYAGVIMRAHNRGDGGVMALAALIRRKRIPRAALLVTLGLLGAGLFLGDGMITPAITVTSAVEGLQVATPGVSHLVIPISLVILVCLFLVQRFGTGAVGGLFGPLLLLWFTVIGVLGASQVVQHPGVLQGLSPTYGARFLFDHGVEAWLTLGAVVLCVTGAEALYADRGHFGAGPIRIAWFAVVLPAVMLSYLGQGALILAHPASTRASDFSPFFQLAPEWGQLPLVVLATASSVVASQSVISGAFSVARQAVQLGFLPRLRVVHTSETEGQIYVPSVNWALMIGVVVLVLVFRSANRLTDLYGMAVTGTFVLDTTLFIAVAHALWRIRTWKLACLGALFWIVELSFFSSNLTKIPTGAWIPLLVGVAIATTMSVWRQGRELITRRREAAEGSLQEFLVELCEADPPIVRLPGTAIFLAPSKATTPLALRAQVEHYRAFQEKVVIASIDPIPIPHVDEGDRYVAQRVGQGLFKIVHVTIRVGYRDGQNIPEHLKLARKRGKLERNLDLEHASYFISRMTIKPETGNPGMPRWRKRLFVIMARNSSSPIDHFGLPGNRTVLTGSQIVL